MNSPPGPGPAYPLERPGPDRDDARFTIGLLLEVAAVLQQHGYPPLVAAADLTRLHRALFTTIYQPKEPT
ncbi:hypothetical protein [Paractinoplanes hotanensis]|uniref:Uncharacterized protein n=1 Tax=Paractinoplanes hotanensis TaxID=2906497 RepID=A0ABT0YIV8_9ACTN|nr:hypothetical protein [Actinoplanes hotanensis]MCM4085204.1 hypothetical protein [Actinoplanes hotanensis]MDY7090956.1 hypothetical protein [Actinomycetota bacterium]